MRNPYGAGSGGSFSREMTGGGANLSVCRDFRFAFLFLGASVFLTAAPSAAGDYEDGHRAYDRGDYKTAYGKWLPLAEEGKFYAQFQIGRLYRRGEGAPKDDGEALRWFQKAAEQGQLIAQQMLAYIYYHGDGAAQDFSKALHWHYKAGAGGNSDSQYCMGVMNRRGIGTHQNSWMAARWFRKAARRGHVKALRSLGEMFRDGEGVKRSGEEAERLFRKADLYEGWERLDDRAPAIPIGCPPRPPRPPQSEIAKP